MQNAKVKALVVALILVLNFMFVPSGVYAAGSLSTKVKTLAEQGFTIIRVIPQSEGFTVLELVRDGEFYQGLIDAKFNWIVRPTDQIKKIGNFSNGIAPVAIQETNKMRLSERQNLLWGYMDKNGKWIIKPQYRYANPFSDGVAFVVTIEKDTDALRNSRIIAIDKNGKYIFELEKKFDALGDEKNIPNYDCKFTNGYLIDYGNIIDTKGKVQQIKIPEGFDAAEFIGNNLICTSKDSENKNFKIVDLKGNIIHSFESEDEYENYSLTQTGQNEIDAFKNDRMIIDNQLVDIKGNIYFDFSKVMQDYQTEGFFDGLCVMHNTTIGNRDKSAVIDLSGKIVLQGKYNNLSNFVHGRAWIEGTEYYKLIDKTGKVLIDESKKVTIEYMHYTGTTTPVVEMKIRETKDDPNFVPCLVNMDTLKIVKYSELLNK